MRVLTRAPVAAHRQVQALKHVFQFEPVGFGKRAFQEGLGHLKPDEIVIRLGGVIAPRHLQHVEAEFGFQVRGGVLRVRHRVAVLLGQLGVKQRHGGVDAQRMPLRVGCVMGQRTQREGVFVKVARLPH